MSREVLNRLVELDLGIWGTVDAAKNRQGRVGVRYLRVLPERLHIVLSVEDVNFSRVSECARESYYLASSICRISVSVFWILASCRPMAGIGRLLIFCNSAFQLCWCVPYDCKLATMVALSCAIPRTAVVILTILG